MAYHIAPITMTLSDLQGHLPLKTFLLSHLRKYSTY